MTRKFVIGALASTLMFVVPAAAQTASELLQKGIYSQETAGDLDGAIAIYRQILGSAFSQRDIVAQAEYRLAESLIRKGDLNTAALEFQKLARDFPDQKDLISKLSVRFAPSPSPNPQVAPPPSQFDPNRQTSVTGEITTVDWVNPRAFLRIKDRSGVDWRIVVESPNIMLKLGWTRNTLKSGDQLIVNGSSAKDGKNEILANTIVFSDGRKLFDRADLAQLSQESATPACLSANAVLEEQLKQASQRYQIQPSDQLQANILILKAQLAQSALCSATNASPKRPPQQ